MFMTLTLTLALPMGMSALHFLAGASLPHHNPLVFMGHGYALWVYTVLGGGAALRHILRR